MVKADPQDIYLKGALRPVSGVGPFLIIAPADTRLSCLKLSICQSISRNSSDCKYSQYWIAILCNEQLHEALPLRKFKFKSLRILTWINTSEIELDQYKIGTFFRDVPVSLSRHELRG